MRCIECKKGTLQVNLIDTKREVAGHTFVIPRWGRTCSICKEVFFDDEEVTKIDFVIARKLIDAGISNGKAFKFVRKSAGLRAASLAELLSVTIDTIFRWETTKVKIPLASRVLLGMILVDRIRGYSITIDTLRAFNNPIRIGRTIEIKS